MHMVELVVLDLPKLLVNTTKMHVRLSTHYHTIKVRKQDLKAQEEPVVIPNLLAQIMKV